MLACRRGTDGRTEEKVCFPAAHHVGAQVDAEDGDRSQRKRNAGDDEEEEGRDLRDVTGQRVRDGLLQVVEDETTCSDQKHKEERKMVLCRHLRLVYLNILINWDM